MAPGTMRMNGQDKLVSAELGGPIFASGAGGMESIACLPLAEGYTTSFRNFDVQKQKEKLMSLKVAGIESVTVAAGRLQDAGLIHYSRGHISILDRNGLEATVCECYQVVKNETDRLICEARKSDFHA